MKQHWSWSCTVPGNPASQARHRTALQWSRKSLRATRVNFYPADCVRYRAQLRDAFKAARPPHSEQPASFPVKAVIRFRLRRPTVHRKGIDTGRPTVAGRRPKPTTKPDLTNTTKMVEDALQQAGVIRDDAHITTAVLTKRWAADPDDVGVTVELMEDSDG